MLEVARETANELEKFAGSDQDDMARYLKEHIVVGSDELTGELRYLFEIEHPNRRVAANVIGTTAETFVDMVRARAGDGDSVDAWDEQIAALSLEIGRVERLLAASGESSPGSRVTDPADELQRREADLARRIDESERRLGSLRSRLQAASEPRDTSQADAAAAELEALRATLRDLQRQKAELLISFTEKHPDVIAVDERIATTRQLIADRSRVAPPTAPGGSTEDIAALRAEIATLEGSLTSMRQSRSDILVQLETLPQPASRASQPIESRADLESRLVELKDSFASVISLRDQQEAMSNGLRDAVDDLAASGGVEVRSVGGGGQPQVTLAAIFLAAAAAGVLFAMLASRNGIAIRTPKHIQSAAEHSFAGSIGLSTHTPVYRDTRTSNRLFLAAAGAWALVCVLVVANSDVASLWVRDLIDVSRETLGV